MDAKDEIMQIVSSRRISRLLHFTRIDNLENILKFGLLSRVDLDMLSIEYQFNDGLRLDHHLEAVSLSIAHPNCKMFFKYRRELEGDWCVIGVSPAVLWERDCLFCRHNAADGVISRIPNEELRRAESLESMFEEIDGYKSREQQRLNSFDPTDEQAEILVLNSVPVEYIDEVVFPSHESSKRYQSLMEGRQSKIHFPDKGYYAARSFLRVYNNGY